MLKIIQNSQKKIFFLLLLLWLPLSSIIQAQGEEDTYSQDLPLILTTKPLFVSLGGTCHTALALRGTGLRKASFPFDWFISTDHSVFLKIFEDDFRHFTDPNCFTLHEGVPSSVNTYYHIRLPHDFTHKDFSVEKGQAQWKEFQTKYDRRIERFRQLRTYRGKVFFVRAMWSQLCENTNNEFSENTKRAAEIRDTLARFFPSLNFTLIILSYNDLPIPPLEHLPGVVEWRIGRSHEEFLQQAIKLFYAHEKNGRKLPLNTYPKKQP